MSTKKGGLGRGLDTLFAESASAQGETPAPSTLPMSEISPDPDQPRRDFNPDALSELADSILTHGVLQPITVRPLPAGGYRIISGERRWRAAMQAGLSEIPAIVRQVSDEDAMEMAMVENLQREDLNPVEEAMGYRNLMDSCRLTQEQAAAKVGKSRPAVANTLRLLELPAQVLELIRSGQLSAGHGRALLALTDEKLCTETAERVLAEKLSVRQTEALCKKLVKGKRPPRSTLQPALPREVQLSLQEALGTEVSVKYNQGKGTLQVHFYNDEQLVAFANLLGNYEKEK